MAKKAEEPAGIRELLVLIDPPSTGMPAGVELVRVIAAKAFLSGWSQAACHSMFRSISGPIADKFQFAMRDFEIGQDDPARVVMNWNKFLKHLNRETQAPR